MIPPHVNRLPTPCPARLLFLLRSRLTIDVDSQPNNGKHAAPKRHLRGFQLRSSKPIAIAIQELKQSPQDFLIGYLVASKVHAAATWCKCQGTRQGAFRRATLVLTRTTIGTLSSAGFYVIFKSRPLRRRTDAAVKGTGYLMGSVTLMRMTGNITYMRRQGMTSPARSRSLKAKQSPGTQPSLMSRPGGADD